MKKRNHFLKLLSMSFALFMVLTSFCVAETSDSMIEKRYGYTETTVITGNVQESDELTCELIEIAAVGDFVLEVVRISAKSDGVFLYPLNIFPGAVFPVTSENALSLVIGKQFPLTGLPEDATGKSVKEYLTEQGKGVLFVDARVSLEQAASTYSVNKCEMLNDGSLLLYLWVGPVSFDDRQEISVAFCEYTEASLNDQASQPRRVEATAKLIYVPSVTSEEINEAKTLSASEAAAWVSKDEQYKILTEKAVLTLYPEFSTLALDVRVEGEISPEELSLSAILQNASGLKMTDFKWEQAENALKAHLYGMNPLPDAPVVLQLNGTIAEAWVGLSIPLN